MLLESDVSIISCKEYFFVSLLYENIANLL